MRHDIGWYVSLPAVLAVALAGCATQVGPTSEYSAAAVEAAPVAAAPTKPATATPGAVQASSYGAGAQTATASGLPDMAASVPPGGSAAPQLAATRSQLPPPTADESRYGIQVAQIGMAAAGGLVDLRLKVLDASKASKLLGNPATVPMLIAGDGPPLHPPHNAMRGAKFGNGVIYYILYPNTRGAIKPGVDVMVAMGDVRLGPVTVQ